MTDRLTDTVEFYATAPGEAAEGNLTAEFLQNEIQRHNAEREQPPLDS